MTQPNPQQLDENSPDEQPKKDEATIIHESINRKGIILLIIITIIIVIAIIIGVYFWQQLMQTTDICADPPTTTDMGMDMYPVDSKYEHLRFLGQFFTAYNCGIDRVNEIYGDNYTLGSTLILKSNPSQSLINALNYIGFVCATENYNEDCLNWELWDVVTIYDLMKLEPYYKNLKGDDCLRCG